MYRFSEVVSFKREKDILLDLNELVRWAQVVIGDNELAFVMRMVLREEADLPGKMTRIEEIMAERLSKRESFTLRLLCESGWTLRTYLIGKFNRETNRDYPEQSQ